VSGPSVAHTGERPIAYQTLAADLRAALAAGHFANGHRLPTEAELSAEYGVSRQTVRRALQDLVAEGLVFRVRGKGTFATPVTPGAEYLRSFGSVHDFIGLSEDTSLETIWPFERKADVEAASRLHLATDQVYAGLFRRLHEGVPFNLAHIFLPPEVGRAVVDSGELPGPGEAKPLTILSVVDKVLSQPSVAAHQSITAVPMPNHLAGFIDCDPDSAVMRIDRLYLDGSGRPVHLAVNYFNPTRYSYRLELRRGMGSHTR
jgi:DNA-binding GntR family transcriptional regulator